MLRPAAGQNDYGQLGDGNEGTDSDVPIAVDTALVSTWTQLSAGHLHSCGLAEDGKAYCWGECAILSCVCATDKNVLQVSGHVR
jgi:alpha-tubulin suppressor-like RCC1 family protein